MDTIELRTMAADDIREVAELIHLSTNFYYQAQGKPAIFTGDPADCEVFCRVYEALDPGCCVIAENTRTGRIVGSCFYHPRATHVSVGIVNVHPSYFGRAVARRMLSYVLERADAADLPVRLVSSAMNLDSFSLYSRAGFVPFRTYQDMLLPVPANGLPTASGAVREATVADVEAMAALEHEVCGIERAKDFRHFIENNEGIWHVSVLPAAEGNGLDGFLVSVAAAACRMIGPGVMRTDEDAFALIAAESDRHRGHTLVVLIPSDRPHLVARMYALGAKNCELHFAQVRGRMPAQTGICLPTFLPETG